MKVNIQIKIIAVFLEILILPWVATAGNNTIERRYVEQKDHRQQDVRWSLHHSDGYSLTYETFNEFHVTRTDDAMSTISWSMDEPYANQSIFAQRKHNTIFITGMFQGKTINKSIEVDEAPWYQATSLSLSKFVLSKKREVYFWTLHPDTLRAFKLKAVKKETEPFPLEGRQAVEAVKVELSLKGILSPLFSCYYWFSLHDGTFLGFVSNTTFSVTLSPTFERW